MLVMRCRSNRSCGGCPGEPLEPALGVLDRADHPHGRQQVERLAEQAAVAGLRRPHVGAVRLDARPERDVVVGERADEEGDLVGRGRHVRVGEDDQVAGRGQHAGPHRRALPAVRHAQDTQRDAVAPRPTPPVAPRPAPRCRRSSRRRRRGRRSIPGAPTRRVRRRVPGPRADGDSRTARRVPDRSARPR